MRSLRTSAVTVIAVAAVVAQTLANAVTLADMTTNIVNAEITATSMKMANFVNAMNTVSVTIMSIPNLCLKHTA
jgi:predicted membrane-bound spermidine synthase